MDIAQLALALGASFTAGLNLYITVLTLGLLDYWKQYGWPDDCRPVGDEVQCGFSSLTAAR